MMTATKLKQRVEQLCDYELEKEISQNDFCALLVNCKLLQADFPKLDDRWINFYSRLTVVDGSEVGIDAKRGRYELIAGLIALITLSQGSTDVKAKAICELFSGRKLLNP